MDAKRLLFFLCLMPSCAFSYVGHYYVSGLVGASNGRLGTNDPQINYTSGTAIIDRYPLNQNNDTAIFGAINAGYEFLAFQLESIWNPAIALGLGIYQTGQYNFNGKVIETAAPDPSSTLYNYHYNIDSFRIMAEAQFTWLLGQFAPFINVGVGQSWNHASNYSESVVDTTGYAAVPPFPSNTGTNLAYQIGLGISWLFNYVDPPNEFKHERLSLGIQYVNSGQTSFGTRGAGYPYKLNVGQLTSYDFYLSYTHLF